MKGSTTDDFFSQQKEKSKIKTHIVSEFFKTYYAILSKAGKTKNGFIYIDLFSGPGVYEDGTKSTPIILLDSIELLGDNVLSEIEMIFNDEDKHFYQSLTDSIISHTVYNKMVNKPQITNLSAKDVNIQGYLNQGKPIFSFVDPWGYKDVSANQIKDFVSAIGSDCIMFFNVNRILQDLSKPKRETHMMKIFGDEYENVIDIAKDSSLSQQEKSDAFLKSFAKNLYINEFKDLKEKGYRLFILPFEFKQDYANKTSHYLVFISKNHKAILEMKRIMVKQSNSHSQTLCYDDKNAMNMCFLSRQDDLDFQIEESIKSMLKCHPNLLNKEDTIQKWYEHLDAYYMRENYAVTTYAFNEFHNAIKKMDLKGYIEVTSPIKRVRITQKAIIKFKKELVED